jgi:N-acyl homoserine lactone hydrolase
VPILTKRAAVARLSQMRPTDPVSAVTTSGIRIHAIQTGMLILKSAHRAFRGVQALALPSILLDPTWTEPLPMLVWVLEHPEGLILIDTGERAEASAVEDYLACDPQLAWFVSRNFCLRVQPEEEVIAQMQRLNLDPAAVRWIIQTHLHFDHVGGLGFFPNAQVVVAKREIDRPPRGSAPCLWPSWYRPHAVEYQRAPLGPFAERWTLTRAGDLHLVPTPGHTQGHQSVILDDGDGATYWCFAGDAAFDERQVWQSEIAGIVHDRAASRRSMTTLRRLMQETPTIFLPTHDPQARVRFAQRQLAIPLNV